MGERRMIWCPGVDRWVTLGEYVAAVRTAKANLTARFPHTLTSWYSGTGADVVRQFFAGVQDRINSGIPYSLQGKQ